MSLRALSLAAGALALVAFAQPASAQAPCLPGLTAHADGAGGIALGWPPVANATAYQVLVRPAGGSFTPLTPQVPGASTAFTYTPQGTADSYEFAVVALHGGSNPIGSFCHAVVASIPFFPTWTATILGLGGALAGVSHLLNRRS